MYKKALCICLVTMLLFTSGCWSRKELNEIAIVLGAAVDKGSDGQVEITVQIAKPSQMSIAAAGGKSGGSRGEGAQVLSSQGKTVFDAVRNFVSITSRKLFWSHNQVLIFGEEAARQGIGQMLDWFERDHEPRARVWVLAARGEAKEILKIPGMIEPVSAMSISDAVRAAVALSKSDQVNLHDFLSQYSSRATSAAMPRIELFAAEGGPKFRISGMAVFKKDKLTGWLDGTAARGLLWVRGRVESGILVVKIPGSEKGELSLEIIKAKSKIKPEFVEGRPIVTVEIEEEGNIGEETVPVDLSKPDMIAAIEKKQAEAIAGEIKAALKFARIHKADIFGFGEEFHRKFPKAWAEMKDRWEEEIPELPVKLKITTKIRRIGDKTISTSPK